jgi:hypothetical protein
MGKHWDYLKTKEHEREFDKALKVAEDIGQFEAETKRLSTHAQELLAKTRQRMRQAINISNEQAMEKRRGKEYLLKKAVKKLGREEVLRRIQAERNS